MALGNLRHLHQGRLGFYVVGCPYNSEALSLLRSLAVLLAKLVLLKIIILNVPVLPPLVQPGEAVELFEPALLRLGGNSC